MAPGQRTTQCRAIELPMRRLLREREDAGIENGMPTIAIARAQPIGPSEALLILAPQPRPLVDPATAIDLGYDRKLARRRRVHERSAMRSDPDPDVGIDPEIDLMARKISRYRRPRGERPEIAGDFFAAREIEIPLGLDECRVPPAASHARCGAVNPRSKTDSVSARALGARPQRQNQTLEEIEITRVRRRYDGGRWVRGRWHFLHLAQLRYQAPERAFHRRDRICRRTRRAERPRHPQFVQGIACQSSHAW